MNYVYQCPKCNKEATLRRVVEDFDDPVDCLDCGRSMVHVFTPNANIQIPIAFRAVRKGGLEGGYTHSDFYDHSEKELANLKTLHGERVEIIRQNEFLSGAGMGQKRTIEDFEAEVSPLVDKAAETAARRTGNG